MFIYWYYSTHILFPNFNTWIAVFLMVGVNYAESHIFLINKRTFIKPLSWFLYMWPLIVGKNFFRWTSVCVLLIVPLIQFKGCFLSLSITRELSWFCFTAFSTEEHILACYYSLGQHSSFELNDLQHFPTHAFYFLSISNIFLIDN